MTHSLHFFFYCGFELQWEDLSRKGHKESHLLAGMHPLPSSVVAVHWVFVVVVVFW